MSHSRASQISGRGFISILPRHRRMASLASEVMGIAALWLAMASCGHAATYYVDASRSDDSGEGASWNTAKKTIQAAVNLTAAGDTVLVTNGVYNTGTTLTPGYALKNRVVITNSITVRSVNGPGETIIEGSGTNWYNTSSAVRCVYMKRGTLDGFTLQNGATFGVGLGSSEDYEYRGAGVNMYNASSETIVINCFISGCRAQGGGGSYYGTLTKCRISGNFAAAGGGSYHGTLNNCTISGNSAYNAGGSFYGTLNNSTISGNSVSADGGGSYNSTLNNCTISGNSALSDGGGCCGSTVNNCVLNNCTISSNSASIYGGGVNIGTLNNCVVIGNSATTGGGVKGCTVKSCTISSNVASTSGGGASGGYLHNCIVWGNSHVGGATNNHASATFYYSCSMPLPSGTGNIGALPLFLSSNDFRLQSGSPCIDKGDNGYVTWVTDLDGNPRILNDVVDMGAYEGGVPATATPVFHPPSGTMFSNSLQVAISCATEGAAIRYTMDGNVPTESAPLYTAPITVTGAVEVSASAFKTGLISRCAVATYHPSYLFVDASRPDDSGVGTSMQTAKRTIQAAVDMAADGATILVASGVYAPIITDKTLTILGVAGETETVIDGGGAGRCATLGSGPQNFENTALTGFTLRNGCAAGLPGGGALGGVLRNCTLTNNFSAYGGGVVSGTLYNCKLVGNGASYGGGAYGSRLTGCAVWQNKSACDGAGINQSTAYDCDIFQNTITNWGWGGGSYSSALYRCWVRGNKGTSAGGIGYGSISNCWVTHNSVTHGIGGGAAMADAYESVIASNACVLSGGGAYGGTLRNCLVFDNAASMDSGGGTYAAATAYCTITRNRAGAYGGGVCKGVHESGIIYSNTAGSGPNHWESDLRFCCTSPDFGVQGCFDGAPLFFDAAANDFRLKYGSPCIDRRTAGVLTPWDQVMTARPLDGDFDGQAAYDVGALEYNPLTYDSDADAMPDLWERLYLLDPVNPADAFMDADGDGHEAWQEYMAGSVPTNSESALHALIAVSNGMPWIAWAPDLGTARVYTVEGSTNLTDSAWGPTNAGSRFFRVKVDMP